MAILVESVVDKSIVGKLDAKSITALNEAIEKEVSSHKKNIEQETAIKFDKLVESITSKFDAQVDKAIVESVHGSIGGDVNRKLLEAMTGVVNILEHAGIYTTEKTKQLTNQLREANKNLEDAYRERQVVSDMLNDEKKVNYILQRLSGARPEIVNAALEYFKDKDIIDVQDEIDAFIDGDFKNLLHDDVDTMDDGLDEITLDQVDDALKDIGSEPVNNKTKSQFEALGKGLTPQRASGLNRVHTTDLNAITESQHGGNYEEDAGIAMNQIENFRDLGYRFNK